MNRIISLAPSITEIVFALEKADTLRCSQDRSAPYPKGIGALVGVTEFCNYPPEARLIDKIGGFSTPDIEKIISLKPHCVLATDFHLNSPVISRLKDMGVNTHIIETKTLLDVPRSILLIGRILDQKKRAYLLAEEIKMQIKAIEEQTAHLIPENKPRVCYICSNCPLRIGVHRCCVEPFIKIAGGVNIGAEISREKVIDLNTIADKNPDVMIVGTGHGETVDLMKFVKNQSILHRTNACQNNRIYRVEADLLRLGPRVVNGLKKFAEFIHPEIFCEAQI